MASTSGLCAKSSSVTRAAALQSSASSGSPFQRCQRAMCLAMPQRRRAGPDGPAAAATPPPSPRGRRRCSGSSCPAACRSPRSKNQELRVLGTGKQGAQLIQGGRRGGRARDSRRPAGRRCVRRAAPPGEHRRAAPGRARRCGPLPRGPARRPRPGSAWQTPIPVPRLISSSSCSASSGCRRGSTKPSRTSAPARTHRSAMLSGAVGVVDAGDQDVGALPVAATEIGAARGDLRRAAARCAGCGRETARRGAAGGACRAGPAARAARGGDAVRPGLLDEQPPACARATPRAGAGEARGRRRPPR